MRRLLHVPSADWTIRQAIRALRGGVGPGSVSDLESIAASALGGPVVAFGSARAALAVALQVLAGPGRTVFVPAFTCVAVPNAVRTAGGRIRWVDVVGPNIDVDEVLRIGKPGDSVIAQHTYGVPVDPAAIRALRSRGLLVVEDRAHRFDGAGVAGDVAIFSLEHSKVVSGGQGGLVRADDQALHARLQAARDVLDDGSPDVSRILRTSAVQRLLAAPAVPAAVSSLGRRIALRVPPLSQPGQSIDELAGGVVEVHRLDPRLAAVALASVASTQANLDHRARMAARYVERLGPLIPDWARVARPYVRMPAIVDDAGRVTRALRAAGLDLGPRWFEAPVHPAGSQSSYRPGSAPNAEHLAAHVITLPTHPLVTDVDLERVISALCAAT